MSLEWIRYYQETNDDPKLTALLPEQRHLWTTLLLLAGRSSTPGVIRYSDRRGLTIEQIMEFGHFPESYHSRVEDALLHFVEIGMITRPQSGVITLTNWHKRQKNYPSDAPEAANERKRRSRKAAKQAYNPPCHEYVTNDVTRVDKTRLDKTRSDETRLDSASDPVPMGEGAPQRPSAPTELSHYAAVRDHFVNTIAIGASASGVFGAHAEIESVWERQREIEPLVKLIGVERAKSIMDDCAEYKRGRGEKITTLAYFITPWKKEAGTLESRRGAADEQFAEARKQVLATEERAAARRREIQAAKAAREGVSA